MRATFAGHSFELIGCDAMHNADKFARFPYTHAPIDCRIEVTVQDERMPTQGDPILQAGDWRCYLWDGGRHFVHRSRTMMIEADDAFERVHLTFSTAMPMMETVLYLQVQRMIGSYLLLHGGGLIHSAGMDLDGDGFLLCGRSGVGKSTMARLLQEIAVEACVLSEDMPALTREDDRLIINGTPLCGDDTQCENRSAPLCRVILLKQAKNNRLVVPSGDEAIYELLTVVPRAVYAENAATAATDLVMALAAQAPIVVFENDGTIEAARMLLSYLQTEPREHL